MLPWAAPKHQLKKGLCTRGLVGAIAQCLLGYRSSATAGMKSNLFWLRYVRV